MPVTALLRIVNHGIPKEMVLMVVNICKNVEFQGIQMQIKFMGKCYPIISHLEQAGISLPYLSERANRAASEMME